VGKLNPKAKGRKTPTENDLLLCSQKMDLQRLREKTPTENLLA